MRLIVAILAFFLASGVLPLTPPSASPQTLSPYDDFSGATIDAGRWAPYEEVTRYVATGTLGEGWAQGTEDMARNNPALAVVNASAESRVASGRLRLALATHGAREQATIAPGRGRLGVAGTSRGTGGLRRVRAKAVVNAATVEPCGERGSLTRAQLRAEFFDDGDPADASTRRAVFATLSLERHTFTGDRIVGLVSRCRNATCTIVDDLGSVQFARSWTPGAVHVLTIVHDPAARLFVFTVSGGSVTAETRRVRHTVAVAFDGTEARRHDLLVENSPATCASSDGTVPRPAVTIDALFDDIALARGTE